MSHSLSEPSYAPVASSLPSGEHATAQIVLGCGSVNAVLGEPSFTFQISSAPGRYSKDCPPAVASKLPSGEKAIAVTHVWNVAILGAGLASAFGASLAGSFTAAVGSASFFGSASFLG